MFWFGPLLGGACGGATFDVIFSTKSSFTRIRNCFTVFHRRDDDTGSEMGDKGHAEAYHDEPAEGEEVGEPRKDGTAPTDELEVLNEKKDQPPSQHKPRRGTNPYCLTHTRCVNKCYRLLSDYFLLCCDVCVWNSSNQARSR